MTFTTIIMNVDTPNLNNRIYTRIAMVEAIRKIQSPILGIIGMPGPTLDIDLSTVSHSCDNFQINEDGSVTCNVTILDTPRGKLLRTMVDLPETGFRTAGSADVRQVDGICEITNFTIYSVNFVNNPA